MSSASQWPSLHRPPGSLAQLAHRTSLCHRCALKLQRRWQSNTAVGAENNHEGLPSNDGPVRMIWAKSSSHQNVRSAFLHKTRTTNAGERARSRRVMYGRGKVAFWMAEGDKLAHTEVRDPSLDVDNEGTSPDNSRKMAEEYGVGGARARDDMGSISGKQRPPPGEASTSWNERRAVSQPSKQERELITKHLSLQDGELVTTYSSKHEKELSTKQSAVTHSRNEQRSRLQTQETKEITSHSDITVPEWREALDSAFSSWKKLASNATRPTHFEQDDVINSKARSHRDGSKHLSNLASAITSQGFTWKPVRPHLSSRKSTRAFHTHSAVRFDFAAFVYLC